MPDPRFEPVGRTYNAHGRYKIGRRGRLGRSMVTSAAAHAGIAFLWLHGVTLDLGDDTPPVIYDIEWLSILEGAQGYEDDPALEEGAVASAEPAQGAPIGAVPDSVPVEIGLEIGADGTALVATALDSDLAALRQRLMGGQAPVPTVVEQLGLSQVPSDAGRASSGDSPRGIPERDLSTADFPNFQDLPGADPMDLDRLTALRPELSLSMPSFWVLIRNPLEVEAYIQRSYRSGALARGVDGAVSIALWIDEHGSVEWAEVSQSSGRADLDQVALALFSEIAQFRPARDEGVAVPRSVIFSVRFPWY